MLESPNVTPFVVEARDHTLPGPRRRKLSGLVGSLPLKKRRLVLPPTFPDPHDQYNENEPPSVPDDFRMHKFTHLPRKEESTTRTAGDEKTNDEKLAVLALMSASHAPASAPSSPWNVCRPTTTTVPQVYHSSVVSNSIPANPGHSLRSNHHHMMEMDYISMPCTTSSPTSSTTTKRSHLPRLDSPLPNGCHGRTSRNNSFCRRQPYKGGIYCKLHYQQYVLRSPNKALQESASSDDAAQTTATSSLLLLAGAPTLPPIQQHQDKRFIVGASDGEVRCKATTTRGRECAYVAVDGSKYCYLHADYDTNPPPRRGGASSRNNKGDTNSSAATETSASTSKVDRSQATAPGTRTLSSPPSTSRVGRRTSDTGASKMGEVDFKTTTAKPSSPYSSFPLLSMVSTDEWAGKRVILSSGPLINRCGRVEKWGNGWVSVRISGVGLHNRRSFELFVHPDQSGVDDTPVQESYYSSSLRDAAVAGGGEGVGPVAALLWGDRSALRPISSTPSEADDQEEERLSPSSSSSPPTISQERQENQEGHSASSMMVSTVSTPRRTTDRAGSPTTSFGTFPMGYQNVPSFPPIVTPRAEASILQNFPGRVAR